MSKQLNLRFSSSSRMKNIFGILSNKERLALYSALFIFLASLIFWSVNYYRNSTNLVPDFGGEYTEGMIGKPYYVNPILAQTNEVDSALSQLIFSSLLKYDNQGGLVNDLAQEYQISEDGTLYTVKLREGILWHDKKPLTAQDVFFTVRLIQNPAYKSALRGDWQDVQANVIDDHTITFKLTKPYAPFPNKLTFGILPMHIYGDVTADSFLLNKFNIEPIGSGPFVYSEYKKDTEDNIISYQLLANQDYYQGKPYLDKINFNFYPTEEALIEAYDKKEINGMGVVTYQKLAEFKNRKDSMILSMKTPRYFAIFFNVTKSKPLADKEVRKALSYATDRNAIINEVFAGYAEPVYSPVLNSFGQFSSGSEYDKYEFNLENAEKILDEAGWKKQDDGIRKKDDQTLEITLITTQWPDLMKTAELIKNQWAEVGARLTITNLALADFQQNYIKPREYQSVLFGQEYFGNDPDPYYFWHSSGKKDPGRNIAVYENNDVDKLIDEAREANDPEKRKQAYLELEKKVTSDAPADFLYSLNYVYLANRKIKGIETQAIINPAYRFTDATHWYIKTKRVKKSS